MHRVAGLALVILLGTPSALLAQAMPFSGWLKVELVSDSIWEHCELSAYVGEDGQGTQRVSCRPDEGEPTVQASQRLAASDIQHLRQLLRDADLFQGQFWGTDLRGLDAAFVTLSVNDRSKAAVLVCYKNESFDVGGRRQLLDWLRERMWAHRKPERQK